MFLMVLFTLLLIGLAVLVLLFVERTPRALLPWVLTLLMFAILGYEQFGNVLEK